MGSESAPVPLRSIHLDLEEWIFTLEGTDGRAIRFSPVQALQQLLTKAHSPLPPPAQAAERPNEGAKEAPGTVTVSRNLKTQPREGTPDRQGKPTATARLAYHQEGAKEAPGTITVSGKLKTQPREGSP